MIPFTFILFMQSHHEESITERIYLSINSIEQKTKEDLHAQLVGLINEFINNDFESLIRLLYRLDISEKKLRKYLNENAGENSADFIAGLIIERQWQKIESRKKYGSKFNPDDHEERW
ncbi:MAG: hypothetical protein ACTHK0_19940 [Ginsengibacter sp.]